MGTVNCDPKQSSCNGTHDDFSRSWSGAGVTVINGTLGLLFGGCFVTSNDSIRTGRLGPAPGVATTSGSGYTNPWFDTSLGHAYPFPCGICSVFWEVNVTWVFF